MNTALDISGLTRAEKHRVMEELWEDLSRPKAEYESPEWHGEALRAREADVTAGGDEFGAVGRSEANSTRRLLEISNQHVGLNEICSIFFDDSKLVAILSTSVSKPRRGDIFVANRHSSSSKPRRGDIFVANKQPSTHVACCSLLEVLVGLIILAIGFLGLAMQAVLQNMDAFKRALAGRLGQVLFLGAKRVLVFRILSWRLRNAFHGSTSC